MQMNVNGMQVETFFVPGDHCYDRGLFPEEGWYWWCCWPRCLPDSDPCGPFGCELAAQQDALNALREEAA